MKLAVKANSKKTTKRGKPRSRLASNRLNTDRSTLTGSSVFSSDQETTVHDSTLPFVDHFQPIGDSWESFVTDQLAKPQPSRFDDDPALDTPGAQDAGVEPSTPDALDTPATPDTASALEQASCDPIQIDVEARCDTDEATQEFEQDVDHDDRDHPEPVDDAVESDHDQPIDEAQSSDATELSDTSSEPDNDRVDAGLDHDQPHTAGLIERATQGSPMPLPGRGDLESRLGYDLGDVEMYAGPDARRALTQLGAHAATVGKQVIVSDTAPDPATVTHEAVHVLQARANGEVDGQPGFEPEILEEQSPAEREACRISDEVWSNTPDAPEAPDTPGAPNDAGGGPIDTAMAWRPQRRAVEIHETLASGVIALRRAPSSPPPSADSTSVAPDRAFADAASGRSGGQRQSAGAASSTTSSSASSGSSSSSSQASGSGGSGSGGTSGGGAASGAVAIEGGGEGDADIVLPAAPEPGVTPADVAERQQELDEAQAALDEAENVNDLVGGFAQAPPTLMAQRQGQLGDDAGRLVQEEEATFQDELPEFHAQLNSTVEPVDPVEVRTPEGEGGPLEGDVAPAPDPDIDPTPEPGRFTANSGVAGDVERRLNRVGSGENTEARAREIGDSLQDVRTTDPDIPRSPGAPPPVPLEGETDPERVNNQTTEGANQARASRDTAQQSVLDGPGPEQVQPIVLDEAYPIGELNQPAVEPVAADPSPQTYLDAGLPPEVQTAFDQDQQPQMQASMATAQTQVDQATTQRDQARETAVADAEQQSRTLSEDADNQQRTCVRTARQEIQNERQSTLDAQSQEVADLENEAQTRGTEDRRRIDTRVSDDEQQIRTRYTQAETDAQAEIQEGERDAEAEQARSEREAENQSWWDRAVNFVKEAFAALTRVIGAIFDAVRNAVNAILDAVKDFAKGLIDAVADFIKSAIALFGEFLKGLVDTLLGDIFPGLAAALNEAIDSAVTAAQEAVDAVADTLKAGVDALVEGLRGAINAALDAFQGAINAALAVIQAAITGDWSEVLRLMIEAVLKVVGVSPDEFYAFIGRAEETFRIIIDNPGGFVGNAIDAFMSGVGKFRDNILAHLQAGIIGWLTGALGPAGITLPATFDLWGVLDLLRQILGLTWERLREKAVRLIGEQNVARLEFMFSYIQTLVEGGWSALWERIQGDLANLRDQVLDGIKNFLLERIVIATITKLASLFNPVGAIVQLVLTAWNLYTFLRDQLSRIIQVVQTVVNAIGDIARGIIDPAATAVEGVLARLLPIVIDLLARLIGLGNVGGRVREIIGQVQERIDQTIDRLIERVLATFRGGGQGGEGEAAEGEGQDQAEQAVAGGGQIGERIPVPIQGEGPHHLYAQASGANATLIFSSDPTPVSQVVARWEAQLPDLDEDRRTQAQPLINRAKSLLSEADREADIIAAARQRAQEQAAAAAAGGASTTESVQELSADEQSLAQVIQQLFPMFVTGPATTTEDRFEQAQSALEGRQFTSDVWATQFEVDQRTAQGDLQWGRENNRVDRVGSGTPFQHVLRLDDAELIQRASRIVGSEGMQAGGLGRDAAGRRKPFFTNNNIKTFCTGHDRLPSDAGRYTEAVLTGIGDLLLLLDAVSPQRDGSRYVFREIPPQRELPDGFSGEDVRNQYYINGSGFGSANTTVRDNEFGSFEDAVNDLLSGDDPTRTRGLQRWGRLAGQDLLPSSPPSSATQLNTYLVVGNYDVDHKTPLAQHWERENGNNTNKEIRRDKAGNLTNLRLMWGPLNRSRGAEGSRYIRWVGPQFTSQFTESKGGPQWADNTRRFKNYES